ncbi:hypothetical protein [Tellurirhabdus rosea]|uniref:hypothetical protein n=1 Tax=Tellurirhabdus rosea TaxID=2674997 RepID=UPI00225C0767|nr:hypothetical protein [Tellurirhabdus rosea]
MTIPRCFFFFIALLFSSEGFSQKDTSVTNASYTSYFFQPSALTPPKGTFVYNNHYILVNGIQYSVTNRLLLAGGLSLIPLKRPPFYLRAQYSLPLSEKLAIAASVTYSQLGYGRRDNKGYLFFPQLLLTHGNPNSHLTLGVGTVRGKYLLGDFDTNWTINLPDQVKSTASVSYSRKIVRGFHFITQNQYAETNSAKKNFSQIILFTAGGRVELGRSSIKLGLAKFFYPKAERVRLSITYAYVGYSLTF